MAAGYLVRHRMTQHGRAAEERWMCKTSATGKDLRTYRMSLLSKGSLRSCPVEGYLGRAATRVTMQVHFLHLHVKGNVVIL